MNPCLAHASRTKSASANQLDDPGNASLGAAADEAMRVRCAPARAVTTLTMRFPARYVASLAMVRGFGLGAARAA